MLFLISYVWMSHCNHHIFSLLEFSRCTFPVVKVVLNTFEAQPLSDEEGNANNLEEESANFSIKYLTSSKLMGLEVINLTNHWYFMQHTCVLLYHDVYVLIQESPFVVIVFWWWCQTVKRPKFSTAYSCAVSHIVWLSEGNFLKIMLYTSRLCQELFHLESLNY